MNNDLVTRIEQATGPDRELDEALGLEGGVASYYGDGAYAGPEYTASIDAAMTLYITVPERVPSDPRRCAAEALRQRIGHSA